MSKIKSALITLCILCLMTACTEKSRQQETVTLKGDDITLATVNGSSITQYELDQTIRSTLGKYSASKLDEKGRRKVLESLVASRAISQVEEKNMTPKEAAVLEKKLNLYREKILVKQYITKNIPPEPVTQEMIQKYYTDHPEKFGEKKTKTYEMIVSRESTGIKQRDKMIQALKDPQEKKDWDAWVKKLQKAGHQVSHRKGKVDDKILNTKLRNLMAPLKKGETSALTFIEGKAYIVRITDEKSIPARPIKDVSARIRKTLAPIQVKKAVKQASEDVLKGAEVVYK